MDLNPDLTKRFLSLAPIDDFGDENGGPLVMPSFFDPGVLEELSGNNRNNAVWQREGWKKSQEFLTHDWRIEREHLDDWIEVMNNFIKASDAAGRASKNFNRNIEAIPQFRIQSPRFQCGLLVGRCTNWRLELRLVEHDHGWTKQKYLGVFLIMDEPVNWGRDELLPEFLNAAVNVQLRKHDDDDTTAGAVLIVASAKTEPLKFGLDPTCTQHACFSDFLRWEEFLSDYSQNDGDPNAIARARVTLRLRMDMFSGTSWLRRPKLSKQIKAKPSEKTAPAAEDEEVSERGDPVITGALQADDIELRMRQLLISGDGADVAIYTCDKKVVKAHREILTTRAPGLAIFINEKSKLHVNFNQDAVQVLLEYIYTDRMRFPKQFTLELVNEVLAAGAVFHVKDLRHDIMEYLATSMGMGDNDKVRSPAIVESDQSDSKTSTEMAMKQNSIDEKYLLDMKEFQHTAKADRQNVRKEIAKFFESRTPKIQRPTVSGSKNQSALKSDEVPRVSNPISVQSNANLTKPLVLAPNGPNKLHRSGNNSKRTGAGTMSMSTGNTSASKTSTQNKRSHNCLHTRAWR